MTLHRRTDGSDADDATLVARVVGGDRDAFETLYERHHLPLFRTALAITRDRAIAEELLQEAFLKAYRHVARVSLDPGASLKPWLHRIIINLAYDWSARRRARAEPADAPVERLAARTLSPERQVEQRALAQVVDEAVADLPFKQRVVVILFYLQDMDLVEIADTLNLPPGTVKSRLYYGRARLRARLESDVRLPVSLEVAHATPHAR